MVEKASGRAKDYSKWEAVGAKISATLKPSFEKLVEKRVRKFSIDVRGTQNLDVLFERPCIIVANHPYPQDKLSQISGISPDSGIIYHVIKEETGESPHFLANYGEKAAPFIKDWPEPLKKCWKRTHKGIIRGYGMLSYDNSPGALPKTFVEDADRIVPTGDSIVVYPWGPWHEDEAMEGNVKRGSAFLARRFNVPILPIYIKGARTWKHGEGTIVVVGESFTTDAVGDNFATETVGKLRRDRLKDLAVGRKIQEEILKLKEKLS